MKRILIIYGSRFGSTEEVCQKLTETLKRNHFEVDLQFLEKPKNEKIFSLNDYDGIIIASGIAMGKWTDSVMTFINNNQELLQSYSKPLGIFVSCARAMKKENVPGAKIDFIDKIVDPLGIKPALTDAFGGCVDFSETSKINEVGKEALKKKLENIPYVDFDGINDFKDWNQINKFADDFLHLLN